MRIAHLLLTTSLALLLPKAAFAGGYGGAWGINRDGQTVHIYDKIYTYRNSLRGRRIDQLVSEVPLEAECDWGREPPLSEAKHLDCAKGTSSPLAGASYRLRFSTKHSNECRRGATLYECIRGCAPKRVPLLFIEEPEEC